MEIKILKNENDIYLVELSGAMDLYSANQLKADAMKIAGQKVESMIINLKKIESVDSSSIGALIYISSTFKKLNCPIIIVAPEGPAMQALEATRLKTYFTIVPTVKEAVSMAVSSM